MAEQEPGYAYSWYVTVDRKRLHGLKPEALKAKRAELKIVKAEPHAKPPPEQQALIDTGEPNAAADQTEHLDPDFPSQLVRQVAGKTRSLKRTLLQTTTKPYLRHPSRETWKTSENVE